MIPPQRWKFAPQSPPTYLVFSTVEGENELFRDEPRPPLVELTPAGTSVSGPVTSPAADAAGHDYFPPQ